MRIALRTLARELRFSTFVVLVLAVGIGATTTVFTVINYVLLRAMPFKNPDRLVWIWSTRKDRDKAFFSIPNFLDTGGQVQTLSDLAAFANWSANLTGGSEAERLQGVRVTGNAFAMLGGKAAAGRLIGGSDAAPGADRAVVVSFGVWQRRFGQRTDALGSKILLNGEPYTLAGVLPADFVLPGAEVDIVGALDLENDPRRAERGSNFLRVFGRLSDAATVQQAAAELSGITERLRLDYPADNAKHTAPRVLYLADEIVGGYKRTLWMLFAAVGVVLAIACANVANLVATRAAIKQRDIAIRTALGASRPRILRELLTESALLSGIGGALGLLFAWWMVRGVGAFFPAAIPRISNVALDFTALVFTVVLSSTVVLGLTFPLILCKRQSNLADQMKRTTSPQTRIGGVPNRGLVIVEVALSTVLMISAGLLSRSFLRLQATDSGIRTDNLLTTRLSLPPAEFREPAALARFCEELTDALQQIQGAQAVGLVSALPLSGINSRTDFIVAGRAPAKLEDTPAAQTRWISSNYFAALGIPIQKGRSFEKFDVQNSEPVVIIDSALANRFMNGLNPLEQSVSVDFGDRRPARTLKVVGVVGDVKHFALDDPPTPTLYFPIDQVQSGQLPGLTAGLNLVIKTAGASLSFADDARRAVSSIDPNVATAAPSTIDQLLEGSVAPRRFTATLFEVFAAAGLGLAVIGLYAVLSYAVVRRRYEIGLRVAFGAKRWQIIGLIVGNGMKVTFIGCVFGLCALTAVGSTIEPLLFDTNLVDPKTYVSMLVLLFIVSALASYVPARRAAAVDPMVAIRTE